MRVALLCATSARTGVETHLRMLASGLAGHGVKPLLICTTSGPLVEQFRELGFEARLAAPTSRLGGPQLLRLARALDDVDVVHAHGPRAIYWSALLRVFVGNRPAVATVHQFRASGLGRAVHRRVFTALETWSIRRHDRVITISADLRRRLLAAGAMRADRFDLIPNTVPLLADRALTRRVAEPPEARALVAARFDPVKGLDVLLDAWGILRRAGVEVPLTLLGDGPDRAVLLERARREGVSDLVRFAGVVDDVPARLEAATMYLAPSRNEGLPGAVLEAMALGIPVIATAVGGHVDLLSDVVPEWLVPAEDAGALAAAVRRLIDLPPEQRLAIGIRLQDRAYSAFAPAQVVADTLRVYRAASAHVHTPDMR